MDFVGGPAHALTIIRILEKLCQLDEATVRDKVIPLNINKFKGNREHQENFGLPKT
jgi:hypothetical protein